MLGGMDTDQPPVDPRSPVQPDRSPAPVMIIAAIAALAAWAAWQVWPDWTVRIHQKPSATQSTQRRPADQPLVGLFTADDYPPDAADRNEQGTTQVAVTVGLDGRVHGCSVAVSSGSASLDRATCRIITARARFSPAQDRNGQAVTGTFHQSVTWRLQD
jgi:protein TonB